MNDGFKRWLCDNANTLSGCESTSCKCCNDTPIILLLIETMWAYQRKYPLHTFDMYPGVIQVDDFKRSDYGKQFRCEDYNNSEQEALEAALFYIYKNGFLKIK